MITLGRYGISARWTKDFWTIDGNRQYIRFRKNQRSDATTYGFIFGRLALIVAVIF